MSSIDSKKPNSDHYKQKWMEAWHEFKKLASAQLEEMMINRKKFILLAVIVFIGGLAFLRGLLVSLFN
jgi:hypothetical protein